MNGSREVSERPSEHSPVPLKRTSPLRLVGRLLKYFLPAVLLWSLVEPHLLFVSRITIRKAGLPPALRGFKIAQISDIHYGPFLSRRMVRKVVEKTNALAPDLVAVTGDYVDGGRQNIAPVFAELGGLRGRYGVLSVFGNHDYWNDVALMKEEMKKAGIEDLEDRAKWIQARGAWIKAVGMGGYSEAFWHVRPDLVTPRSEDFVILLCHNPDHLRSVPPEQVDLAFCGHTHGGQFTFFGLFAPFLPPHLPPRYTSGVYERGTMTVVVSRGIGTYILPLRFFAPPQIMLVTLEGEEGK